MPQNAVELNGLLDKTAVTSSDIATHIQKNPALSQNRDSIVPDEGAGFTSSEFHQFMENNEIGDIRCAPYHPATNGEAEKAVQVFNEGMKYQTGETSCPVSFSNIALLLIRQLEY
ncbi:Zinc knuckle domain containing protein [Plakobranchus ocellatus]|uniref:Zinc knuckle domain containing protein n=1 Tax=Plakobranchus ocellatus TaxID=259542 RepID=A0AAV4BKN7_9GAST|nr:Zinc knuckle domain containing protein [Plakobranchus ocellatus]